MGLLSTYWLECRDFRLLSKIVDGVLHVVDCHAPVGLFKLIVSDVADTLVGAVAGAEVKNCGPVVAEVGCEGTSGAC